MYQKKCIFGVQSIRGPLTKLFCFGLSVMEKQAAYGRIRYPAKQRFVGEVAVCGGSCSSWGPAGCPIPREAFMRDAEEYESLEEYERAFE